WTKLDQLEQGTVAIPSTEPVRGTNFTSGYGVRSDPFKGRAAMHAGIDLAGPIGTPIYATADATVGRSEYNSGGYGNLVELEHGHGIQTRYGHLSKSLVTAGQRVKRGEMIGLMGSTGRSTGSHLHYEVRIDGKAVNPVPFLQSNSYLQSVQQRAAAASRIAIGGPAAGN
ncbi:MAG TPA: M23 family metallopeptidase, partial [Allosphingosinicella sp.]|nr:M23 family metallopeptidase [Allosphingosinicella sp.]